MKETIKTLITSSAISKRIDELAEQIMEDYAGKTICMVCILKGGVVFMVELAKKIKNPVLMNFMDLSSYGNGTTSSGEIKVLMDLDEPVDGMDVLIVEDILDTGRTLNYVSNLLKSRNAKSVKICTLLDKPDKIGRKQIDADYVGFSIPDEFVVGCGLDYAQKYRNLDYIGVISFEEE